MKGLKKRNDNYFFTILTILISMILLLLYFAPYIKANFSGVTKVLLFIEGASFNVNSFHEVDNIEIEEVLEFDESLALNKNFITQYEEAENFTQASILTFNASDFGNVLSYPENYNEKSGEIKFVTYGKMINEAFFDLDYGQVYNATTLSNSVLINELSDELPFEILADGSFEVLIMHTHTTESFQPYERDYFDNRFDSRSTDESMNIVSVGEAIVNELAKAGIGVIHDVTVHDYPQYDGSYDRSRVRVEEILEEYPTIKVVLDIHRDGIGNDEVWTAPIANINGENAAQIMIISGCEGIPLYKENFKFAAILQNTIEEMYPTLTRPLLFDYRHYNQDLTTGSILIEVGSHGNSIEQAIYSGELLGKALVESLLR